MDSVHMFPGPQTIFPGVFRPQEPMLFSHVLSEHLTLHITPKANQYSPKYFGTNRHQNIPFSYVLIAHNTPKAEQYSPKYFGTNCCQKISLSHGFSPHVPRAADNIPWSISALRAAEIFNFHVYQVHLLPHTLTNIL